MADSNSITLSDYALMSNSPLVQKFTYSLIQFGSVLQDIPLRTYKSMTANGSRFLGAGLATVGYRKLNEAPAVTKSVPTAYQEQAYIVSNNFDIDTILLEDVNRIQDPFATQMSAYLRALTYDFNDKFINNDPINGDADAPVGLRYRLDNYSDYQIPSEMKFAAGGSTIDISAGSNGDALAENLQKMLDIMGSPDGTGVVLYGSELLWRKISRAILKLGTGGGFRIDQDQFGRQVTKYQNAIVRKMGRKADQTTQILTDTESTTGASSSSNYSSLYGVHYGLDQFSGWQFRNMEEAITGPYLLTATGTQQQITFDWPVGLWQEHIRSVSRMYGLKTS